jgi:hypothetical protein
MLKRTSWVLEILMFLVHENEILDSKINGSGNDFMDNLNMIMDYQCLATNYFLNNLLK